MLEIKLSSLPISNVAQSPEHIPLIRPSILPFLHKPPSTVSRWIAIEAHIDNEIVGLTLSEVYDEHWKYTAQLYSFIVKPEYRRQGIGRQLFAFTQDLLIKKEKISSFEFFYTQEDPFSPAIEKILASQGWSAAKTSLIRCDFDVTVFNPQWLHYSNRLSPSMHFFSWKDLRPTDRSYIEYLAYQRRFVPYLNPLVEEELIDLETSVGLRQNEKIVGWSITKRRDPSTICYSILYIDSAFLHQGCGIQLLVESIRRQKHLHIPNAILEINVREIDPSWARFIKKRLFPLARKIEHVKHAFRVI